MFRAATPHETSQKSTYTRTDVNITILSLKMKRYGGLTSDISFEIDFIPHIRPNRIGGAI